MAGVRHFPKPLSDRETCMFDSAEEAWLWFSRCQLARLAGVRFTADRAEVARPCEPDDIYRAVSRLYRQGVIDDAHIAVLGKYGLRLSAPDPWAGDPAPEADLWGRAMDGLAAALRRKGVVA